MKKSVNQLIFVAGLLSVWEGLALLKLWPPYVFPTPRGVAESFWAGFAAVALSTDAGGMNAIICAYQ